MSTNAATTEASETLTATNTPWHVDVYNSEGNDADHRYLFNSSLGETWSIESTVPVNVGSMVMYTTTVIPALTAPAGSTVVALYDARNITGLSNGGAVTTWPDSSGNGLNLTVGHGAPTYNSADASLGGKPSVTFNSSTCDVLHNITGTLPTSGTGSERMVLVVMNPTTIVANGDVVKLGLRALST